MTIEDHVRMDLSAMDLGGNRTEGNMRLEIGAHHEHSVYFFDFFDDGSWDFFDSGLDFFDSGMYYGGMHGDGHGAGNGSWYFFDSGWYFFDAGMYFFDPGMHCSHSYDTFLANAVVTHHSWRSMGVLLSLLSEPAGDCSALGTE